MKNKPRNHHYLSQCYLRGFTETCKSKSKIHVFDKHRNKQFSTNPRNIGGIRDFNRVDIEGVDPNYFETSLSVFEGKVAETLISIEKNKTFDGNDKIIILNLIALMGARSPQFRENIRQFEERLLKTILKFTTSNNDIWESQIKKSGLLDKFKSEDIDFERFKDFVDRDEYSITSSRAHQLSIELLGIDIILNTLVKRNWSLLWTSLENGLFVTSDHPVLLTYKKPINSQNPIFNSPGYGLQGTQIIFPITKYTLLIGEYENDFKSQFVDAKLVRILNSFIYIHAYEQVYSSKNKIDIINFNN